MRRFHALLIAAGLAAMPASAAAGPSPESPSTTRVTATPVAAPSRARLGVVVMPVTPELRTHLGATADRGVLVAQVEPGTPGAAAGIAVGDVIAAVRGRAISAPADVLTALADVPIGQDVLVEVVRDRKVVALRATLAPASSPTLSRWLHDMLQPFAPAVPLESRRDRERGEAATRNQSTPRS